MNRLLFSIMLVVGMLYACPMSAQQYDGLASYYGIPFHGRKAANGKTYNMYEMTCAHKSLPFGTKVKVTNLNNQKSVVVTVTDRGPYKRGRVVDLSVAAARELDFMHRGVVPVTIEVIKDEEPVANEFTAEAKELEPVKKNMEFKFDIQQLEDKEFKFPNLLHDHQAS